MVPQKLLRRPLCGASKGFMKALKALIKPFGAPQRSVKIKIKLNFLFQYNFQKCTGWEGLILLVTVGNSKSNQNSKCLSLSLPENIRKLDAFRGIKENPGEKMD